MNWGRWNDLLSHSTDKVGGERLGPKYGDSVWAMTQCWLNNRTQKPSPLRLWESFTQEKLASCLSSWKQAQRAVANSKGHHLRLKKILEKPVSSLAAAAAAKSLQSCPTPCDPIDGSPLGFPVPGILQARTLEWVAISFSNAWKWKVKVNLLSSIWPLATPWTIAYQAPPSMGFSRQEYWSGVPLLSPKLSIA